MNKQISRVAIVSLVLLGALIVATTYWQTWATGGLAARQDNEIQRVAQFEIRRGTIYAANGKTVLATNVRKKVGGKTLYFRTLSDERLRLAGDRLLDAEPLARRARARGELVPDRRPTRTSARSSRTSATS